MPLSLPEKKENFCSVRMQVLHCNADISGQRPDAETFFLKTAKPPNTYKKCRI